LNARLKKIVLLASASAKTEQVLKNFTSEERYLYEYLFEIINEWRSQILKCNGEE
jgi:DNA replication initiation complex subunit (GINS family)